jgi:PTH1 family peptidyl-tRNA hydrolase
LKLVIGLGNPGKEYDQTRHNIGFMVVEEIARRQGVEFKKMFWFPARQAKCRIGEHEVRLIEPTTFMNRSGKAVWGAMKKWRVEATDTVVVYDDVDLELGGIRVRGKGSGGSHNGMKSILEWLQTKAFPRVRVGIGPKPEGDDMISFVLGCFAEEELLKLEKVVERAADAVESIFSIGTERTMNTFNQSKIGLS